MDLKITARMLAVLVFGAAVAFAAAALREDGTEEPTPSPVLRHPGGEPMSGELARCRDLGPAAAGDATCQAAWAENRRRFLGLGAEAPRP